MSSPRILATQKSGESNSFTFEVNALPALPSESSYSYQWDFGDESSSDEPSPIHVYPNTDANYTVKVRVRQISNNVGGGGDEPMSFLLEEPITVGELVDQTE